jgi:hypothetical protein|tara:strand:+ start:59 stop:478 length:420 start_codon:yes stop_codon:yes gene_type:complete
MATTTAAVTLTSDLLSDNISVTTDTTCVKGGTTADGLDQMDMGYIEIATGTNFDLLDADNALNKDKANKVYIANESTDETYYVVITIDATVVGRLYAGDWMFIPWGAEDATADIEIQAYTGTNKISYAYFHEGRTLTSA